MGYTIGSQGFTPTSQLSTSVASRSGNSIKSLLTTAAKVRQNEARQEEATADTLDYVEAQKFSGEALRTYQEDIKASNGDEALVNEAYKKYSESVDGMLAHRRISTQQRMVGGIEGNKTALMKNDTNVLDDKAFVDYNMALVSLNTQHNQALVEAGSDPKSVAEINMQHNKKLHDLFSTLPARLQKRVVGSTASQMNATTKTATNAILSEQATNTRKDFIAAIPVAMHQSGGVKSLVEGALKSLTRSGIPPAQAGAQVAKDFGSSLIASIDVNRVVTTHDLTDVDNALAHLEEARLADPKATATYNQYKEKLEGVKRRVAGEVSSTITTSISTQDRGIFTKNNNEALNKGFINREEYKLNVERFNKKFMSTTTTTKRIASDFVSKNGGMVNISAQPLELQGAIAKQIKSMLTSSMNAPDNDVNRQLLEFNARYNHKVFKGVVQERVSDSLSTIESIMTSPATKPDEVASRDSAVEKQFQELAKLKSFSHGVLDQAVVDRIATLRAVYKYAASKDVPDSIRKVNEAPKGELIHMAYKDRDSFLANIPFSGGHEAMVMLTALSNTGMSLSDAKSVVIKSYEGVESDGVKATNQATSYLGLAEDDLPYVGKALSAFTEGKVTDEQQQTLDTILKGEGVSFDVVGGNRVRVSNASGSSTMVKVGSNDIAALRRDITLTRAEENPDSPLTKAFQNNVADYLGVRLSHGFEKLSALSKVVGNKVQGFMDFFVSMSQDSLALANGEALDKKYKSKARAVIEKYKRSDKVLYKQLMDTVNNDEGSTLSITKRMVDQIVEYYSK